jgi:putative membrane protein
MTDANILALMAMSDSMEIAAGQLARTKARDAKVKRFAQMMVTEHTKMKKEGEELVNKAQVTPQMPSNMPMSMDMSAQMDSLRNASGAAFDVQYINQQVMMHEMVLQQLNGASPQDDALRAHVEKAKQHVQKHLEEARTIQSGLANTAASQ